MLLALKQCKGDSAKAFSKQTDLRDLHCMLQVACESLGPLKKGGRVIGVDLQVGA